MTLLGRAPIKRRGIELASVGARWTAYVAVLLSVPSPSVAGAFSGVQLAIFGFYMGCSFAPNHQGMRTVRADARIN